MKTKNTTLLNIEENRKYYSQSDGNFMDLQKSRFAHRHIDRIKWLVEKVHMYDSRTHISIGCKDGYEVITLAEMGVDAIGVDPSEDAIADARLKAQQLGYDPLEMFKVGFLEDMPDGLVADTVSMLEVLEHVVDAESAIEKLSKMGRAVLLSTPDAKGRHGMKDSERNQEHVRVFTKKELEELVSKYGKIEESVIRDDQICISFKPNKQ